MEKDISNTCRQFQEESCYCMLHIDTLPSAYIKTTGGFLLEKPIKPIAQFIFSNVLSPQP